MWGVSRWGDRGDHKGLVSCHGDPPHTVPLALLPCAPLSVESLPYANTIAAFQIIHTTNHTPRPASSVEAEPR